MLHYRIILPNTIHSPSSPCSSPSFSEEETAPPARRPLHLRRTRWALRSNSRVVDPQSRRATWKTQPAATAADAHDRPAIAGRYLRPSHASCGALETALAAATCRRLAAARASRRQTWRTRAVGDTALPMRAGRRRSAGCRGRCRRRARSSGGRSQRRTRRTSGSGSSRWAAAALGRPCTVASHRRATPSARRALDPRRGTLGAGAARGCRKLAPRRDRGGGATLCSRRYTGRRIAYEYAMTAIVPR